MYKMSQLYLLSFIYKATMNWRIIDSEVNQQMLNISFLKIISLRLSIQLFL
jgi:hypothetical protein